MVTQQAAIEEVKDLVKGIKGLGIHLRKAILFGSYARNEQRNWSDIDVALVADEFSGIGFDDIGLFGKALVHHIEIQPRTYPTDYFEQGDPFIEEIIRTGIEIEA